MRTEGGGEQLSRLRRKLKSRLRTKSPKIMEGIIGGFLNDDVR